MFDEYIAQVLAPTLNAGDILILDNPSAHKSAASRDTLAKYHAEMKFLPPYSPDLNPIEKMWSKLKQQLRSVEARTDEQLFSSIGKALDMISPNDARGWFNACGYIVPES